MTEFIRDNFSGPLAAFFHPINDLFTPIPVIWWKLCAVGLFVAAMVWVYLLKREYVNIDAPGKGILYDLRFWTIMSMLPHVLIYLWLATGTSLK